MPEAPTLSESEGPKAPSVAKPREGWRANLLFIADVGQKLAIPLLTVAATGLGFYLNWQANERAADSNDRAQELSLQNQREQSETSIRSAMFGALVDALMSQEGEGEDNSKQAARRLAMQAELLTLNFHEHFDLGPALRYVDGLEGQTSDTRERLRRAVRRVMSRQLAPMMPAPGEWTKTGRPPYVEIHLSEYVDSLPSRDGASGSARRGAALPSCYREPKSPADDASRAPADTPGLIEMICSTKRPMQPLPLPDGSKPILVQVPTEPLIISSPDGRDSVKISLTAFDWDNGTVAVFAELQSPEPPPQTGNLPRHSIEFTLSPYSLPFTDNTLLPSGNRFGMYIKSADELNSLVGPDQRPVLERLLYVLFVWFPKDFVPPRERPVELDVKVPDS